MNTFNSSEWIWLHQYNDAENTYLDFWETVTVRSGGKKILHISADADYAVYVDGVLSYFGQYPDYTHYKVYDSLDLTGFLSAGEHRIRITVHANGRDFLTYRKEQPGVIYALFDGEELLLSSSENTLVSLNPHFENGNTELVTFQLGFSFSYHEIPRPAEAPRCHAQIVSKTKTLFPRPVKKLITQENKPARIAAQGVFRLPEDEDLTSGQTAEFAYLSAGRLKKMTEDPARCVVPSKEGIALHTENCGGSFDGIYCTLDLGEESAGVFSIDIDLPEEAAVLVSWGEHLCDLRPRAYVGGRNFAFWYYARSGRNTFVNPFLRLGLRYLQIHVFADAFRLYYAGIKPTDLPVPEGAYFRCSDQLHNRIFETSVRTVRLCMHEHYEDCPWREQALYPMDSRNQMLTSYLAIGETDLARESIRLMALSQREDGFLENCSPARFPYTIPSFTLVFVVQLREYLLYSGDLAFIREMLPAARNIVSAFLARLEETGLLKCLGEEKYWNFYEWAEGVGGGKDAVLGIKEEDRTYDAPLNAFFSMALKNLAELENACGNEREADLLKEKKRKLDLAADELFWDPERGAYVSFVNGAGERTHFTELTNALFVYADICPAEKQEQVLSALVRNELQPVTLSHLIFKYEALLRRPDLYGRAVFRDIADKWGKMLFDGATAFYEAFDGAAAFGDAGSLCHGWSGTPAYLYMRYALGVHVLEDGFAKYERVPVSSGLYETEGAVLTPVGKVECPRLFL